MTHLLHNVILLRGNDFLKPLIILDQSILRGGDNLGKISEYIAKGDNVVILSNHQTEADPQVSNRTFFMM
jgi:glycerol-3-phosphate O-acyltransferase